MRSALILLLLLSVAVPADSTPVDELLSAAGAEIDDHEYRRGQEIYSRVLAREPGNRKALIGLAKCLGAVGEQPAAERIYRKAAELDPAAARPWRGLGGLAIYLDRKEEARRLYTRGLEIDPEDPGCLAGLARVDIEEGRFESADELLTKAEAADPDSVSVLSTRVEYWFRKKEMTWAARLLRKIVEKDPTNLGANHRLANGFLETDREPYRPPIVPKQYDRQVRRGIRLYRTLELERAEAVFAGLDVDDAPDGRPAFFRGLVELRRGRMRAAIPHLRRAVEREPLNLLFRNAWVVAYRMKIAAQRAEYGGGGGPNRIRPIAEALTADEPGELFELVRGYGSLLPAEKKVIRRAAAPFAKYLPKLRRAGVTHDVLGFEEGICDAPERAWLRAKRTHDLRWYGGLRGVGGKNAATGIESVLAAGELRYDTFAHEFAHQVHYYGFTRTEKAVVRDLYSRALAADHCLDYYAKSNEREYLAQGYEAFVSVVKSPFFRSLRRHDRAELRARDPGLYRFLLRITGTPDPDPAVAPHLAAILGFYEWAGDPLRLRRVRLLYGPPPAAEGR